MKAGDLCIRLLYTSMSIDLFLDSSRVGSPALSNGCEPDEEADVVCIFNNPGHFIFPPIVHFLTTSQRFR